MEEVICMNCRYFQDDKERPELWCNAHDHATNFDYFCPSYEYKNGDGSEWTRYNV